MLDLALMIRLQYHDHGLASRIAMINLFIEESEKFLGLAILLGQWIETPKLGGALTAPGDA